MARIRALLDPGPAHSLSPKENLAAAEGLLVHLDDGDVDKCFVIKKLIAEHTQEARKDPRLMLKAPSTADWINAEVSRWADHPGQFLVTHTVDAQNSFGVKLRARYQCS